MLCAFLFKVFYDFRGDKRRNRYVLPPQDFREGCHLKILGQDFVKRARFQPSENLGKILGNIFTHKKGGSYGNNLYKNLDLTQDFPNKISFHFLWVKMLPKNLPKIFRWPEMCPLDKILAQDFQMAAFTKILGRRETSVVPLLYTENCRTLF